MLLLFAFLSHSNEYLDSPQIAVMLSAGKNHKNSNSNSNLRSDAQWTFISFSLPFSIHEFFLFLSLTQKALQPRIERQSSHFFEIRHTNRANAIIMWMWTDGICGWTKTVCIQCRVVPWWCRPWQKAASPVGDSQRNKKAHAIRAVLCNRLVRWQAFTLHLNHENERERPGQVTRALCTLFTIIRSSFYGF